MTRKNPVSKTIVPTGTRPGSITVTVTVSGDGVGVTIRNAGPNELEMALQFAPR